jgi:hypothetical protein
VTNFLRKYKAAQLKQSNWHARMHKFKQTCNDSRRRSNAGFWKHTALSLSRARLAADLALPNLTQTPCYGELVTRNNIEWMTE